MWRVTNLCIPDWEGSQYDAMSGLLYWIDGSMMQLEAENMAGQIRQLQIVVTQKIAIKGFWC